MDDVPPTGLPSSKPTHTDKPIVFGFEGEYSIISVRETAAGKLGIDEMWKRIGRIVKEMERVTQLKFKYVFSNPPLPTLISFISSSFRIREMLTIDTNQLRVFFYDQNGRGTRAPSVSSQCLNHS